MISINLAFDEKITDELICFFKHLGIDAEHEGSEILVNKDIFDQGILETFLKKTKREREGYVIKKINAESYLISKQVDVEDFGLATCEICGYVTFEEELLAHRRTHGI